MIYWNLFAVIRLSSKKAEGMNNTHSRISLPIGSGLQGKKRLMERTTLKSWVGSRERPEANNLPEGH